MGTVVRGHFRDTSETLPRTHSSDSPPPSCQLVAPALLPSAPLFSRASCRPDVFPTPLCAALASLHSQAPRHGWRHTEREVREALGAPVDQLFEDFERQPIASGSIAQIHRAICRNQTVAVKVRHPAVVRRIVTDFTLMRAASDWLARLFGVSGLKASVTQFSGTMVAQTRLDIEAEHLRRFGWNFAAWRDVRFPRVIAASEAVLVESFEAGELVSTYTTDLTLGVSSAGGGADPLSREEAHFVVSRGEDLYLKMLLLDNLMHADLHPGNILLRRARRYSRNSLALLDVGMVARLTRREADAFIGFLNAMGAGDGAAAARCVLRFSDSQACTTREEFEADMSDLFRRRCRGYGTGIQLRDPRCHTPALLLSTTRSAAARSAAAFSAATRAAAASAAAALVASASACEPRGAARGQPEVSRPAR
mmetsp:Transcript_40063/g.129707  ORF Transcript_40063/g.129707 Transcript_40063/m.129707 type:complete len:423 (-) Transcript_40063:70-1338(-)